MPSFSSCRTPGFMSDSYFVKRSTCPVCKSTAFSELYRAPYQEATMKAYLESFYGPRGGGVDLDMLVGASYVLCECQSCKALFQQEIPSEKLMFCLYERWLDPKKSFDRRLERDDLNYFSQHAEEIMQLMAFISKHPPEIKILDFGMGWGKWALMAKAFGCEVLGCELSHERIAYARSQGIRVVGWDELPELQVDFVNTEQVFEHLAEPLETLQHIRKALKPSGVVKVSVPTATNIEARLKKMDWLAPKGSRWTLNPVAPLEHINFFRKRSLIRMGELTGLQEVKIPLATQYRYSTNWGGRSIWKKFGLPLYRNFFEKQNYVFFRAAR